MKRLLWIALMVIGLALRIAIRAHSQEPVPNPPAAAITQPANTSDLSLERLKTMASNLGFPAELQNANAPPYVRVQVEHGNQTATIQVLTWGKPQRVFFTIVLGKGVERMSQDRLLKILALNGSLRSYFFVKDNILFISRDEDSAVVNEARMLQNLTGLASDAIRTMNIWQIPDAPTTPTPMPPAPPAPAPAPTPAPAPPVTTPPQAHNANWQSFANSEGRFRAMLPNKPERKIAESPIPGAKNFTTLASGSEGLYCFVGYMDFSVFAMSGKEPEEFLEDIRSSVIKEIMPGKIQSERKAPRAGYPGCELVCQTDGRRVVMQLVLVNNRLYTLFVVHNGSVDQSEAQKFFDSFQLTK